MIREWPYSAHEFAHHKLVVAALDRVILFHNWECVRVYIDATNTFKDGGYLTRLPGFDDATFPFLALAGSHSISILNVERSEMRQVVVAESTCRRGQ